MVKILSRTVDVTNKSSLDRIIRQAGFADPTPLDLGIDWEARRQKILEDAKNLPPAPPKPPTPEQKLQAMLEPLSKNGYWKPPHNMAINFAIFGTNLWYFTLLPLFWQKRAYRSDLGGIVIHPIWAPFENGEYRHGELTERNIGKVLQLIEKQGTVQDSIKRELRLLEQFFKIQIPPGIEQNLLKDSLKVAKRRWGVDRMKIKNTLVPLDGGKPRNLNSFE